MKKMLLALWTQSPKASAIAVVIIAFIAGYLMKGASPERPAPDNIDPALQGVVAGKNAERMVYVCPTMCIPPVAKPGTCPICGMQLVAVSGADAGDSNAVPRIRLSEEAVKLAEIQVAAVERKAVAAEITAFGQLEYFPPLVSEVTANISGIISKVYPERVGVAIKYGDPLFEIYSYEIYLAQQELLAAAKSVPVTLPLPPAPAPSVTALRAPPAKLEDSKAASKGAEADRKKVAALLQRLGRLGLTQQDMELVLQKREPKGTVTVYARLNGLLLEKEATLGTYVNIGAPLCVIANPQNLWVTLSVYESDFPWLRINQAVEFQTEAYPGERFEGRVASIGPVFNKESRTFEVVVKIPESVGKLRADMAVRAIIRAELTAGQASGSGAAPGKQAPLVIPATAPLLTGKRAVVYVAVPGEKGMFEGREVVLGPRAKKYYVVREGLKEGEQVVVNGSFKIDSALQILAKPSLINSIETDQVRMQIPFADSATVNAAPADAQKK